MRKTGSVRTRGRRAEGAASGAAAAAGETAGAASEATAAAGETTAAATAAARTAAKWATTAATGAAVALAAALSLAPADARGQEQEAEGSGGGAAAGGPAPPPVLEAARLVGPAPSIDGALDEADWATAMAAGDFVVFQPNEGEAPSQRTEARVLYGDEAVYVGIRAFDTSPDSIESRLARRDENPHSDWVDVVIDSYHDRRTAFRFSVNPAGVKRDIYMYDDVREDVSWDAVWDVATAVDAQGWTAEFRIPYSQLRFDGAGRQTWGINFVRTIARHLEVSLWAPISRGDGALVSRFGDLEGLRDLSPPRRLEALPYSLLRLESAPGEAANPFYDPRDFSSAVGADVKYGITTDLTLDLAINPDFGQVEADPAQVNLSAFETFFPERRPFFVEGANIFAFGFSPGDGDQASEGLFYSRRIGRPPQGRPSAAAYADAPEQTRILGAAKLSGKTRSGWSLGFLHALAGNETARRADASGPLGDEVVEPAAHYGVGRVSKDFRDGKSAVGAISTWTVRDGASAGDLRLHGQAYAGGFDARHRFGGDRFVVSGYLLGSTVRGAEEAIERTQRSPARYFQRPDADHVELDPARTSLDGWAGSASFSKISGGYWRYGGGVVARSPGFDANDLGFMRESDFVNPWLWAGYNHYKATERFQRWNLNLNAWDAYSFGGEHFSRGGNVSGSFTLKNFWGGYAGVRRNSDGLTNTALRGGPMLRRDGAWGGWFGFWSDSRKQLSFNTNNQWEARPESGSWSFGTNASIRWRPSSRATVSAGPSVRWRAEDLQWVRRLAANADGADAPLGAHYLFGRLDQTTVGLTVRADWTFSPTLSLQLYAQPFVSAGDYDHFKRITDPRAERYADRFAAVAVGDAEGETLEGDMDGDGAPDPFRNPDFNFKQFRSNAVLRWEYKPGSAVFLVWSQGRNHYDQTGEFSLGDDVSALLGQPSQDVFMVKASYWIG